MHNPLSDLQEEPGWLGVFTRQQAPGAIQNGTTIVKSAMGPGDGTPIGTRGTVLGSFSMEPFMPGFFYFVEWENKPRVAVGIRGRITPLDQWKGA